MKTKTIERIVSVTKLSIPINAVTAVGKIVISILTGSFFLLLNAFYSVGIALAKSLAIKPIIKSKKEGSETLKSNKSEENCFDSYYIVGIIILVASLCYTLYSITFFFGKNNIKYPMVAALAIATFTFTELTLSIRGIVIAKKNKNIQVEAIKLINFASSLISLVLTQTAIMSFAHEGDKSSLFFYNGITGVTLGFLAACIGIFMIIYTNIAVKRNNKNKKSDA